MGRLKVKRHSVPGGTARTIHLRVRVGRSALKLGQFMACAAMGKMGTSRAAQYSHCEYGTNPRKAVAKAIHMLAKRVTHRQGAFAGLKSPTSRSMSQWLKPWTVVNPKTGVDAGRVFASKAAANSWISARKAETSIKLHWKAKKVK